MAPYTRYNRFWSYFMYELLGMPIIFLFTLVFCEEPSKWLAVTALIPLPAFLAAERVEKSLWTLLNLQQPDWKLLLRFFLFGLTSWIGIIIAFWAVPELFEFPVDTLFGLGIAAPPAALLTLVAAQLGKPVGNEN